MTATSPSRGGPLLALLALAGAGCELPPYGPVLDPGPEAEVDCSACHVVADLLVPVSAAPARQWVGEQGSGVVRDPAVLSLTGEPVFSVPWPSRGHHDPERVDSCASCHPVHGRTSGHGLTRYPETAAGAAFSPRADCARGCHGWLPEQAEAPGFEASNGELSRYSGSLRPADLLALDLTGGGGHGRSWAGGYRRNDEAGGPRLRLSSLAPGCGGCHNRFAENHGEVATCADCHDLEASSASGSHGLHVARIDAWAGDRAPEFADRPACAFCHCREPEPDRLCRAACYNCHLGGHAPSPILWTGDP